MRGSKSILDTPLGNKLSVLSSPDKKETLGSRKSSYEDNDTFKEALLKELQELKRDIKLQNKTRV